MWPWFHSGNVAQFLSITLLLLSGDQQDEAKGPIHLETDNKITTCESLLITILCFNSPVLNSLKDFLLRPAPLLVKLSETAKKPTASIVMTVSSDANDNGVTVGHTTGVKKDSQDTAYQKVRKVALDSICRWVLVPEVKVRDWHNTVLCQMA